MKDVNHFLDSLEKEIVNQHYYKRYVRFIKSRYIRNIPKNAYTEIHHILPKAYGGSNEQTNLIKLTAREHFISHWILWKAAGKRMQRAFHMISHVASKGQKRVKIKSSKVYSKLKEEISKDHNWRSNPNHPNYKRDMTGKNNGMFGKNHTDESKKSMSIKHKGKILSESTKEKMSKSTSGVLNPMFGKKGKDHPAYGIKRTQQQIKDISDRTKGENNPMARKIVIEGEIYKTIKEAAVVFNIHPSTVGQRINSKSDRFKEWKYH